MTPAAGVHVVLPGEVDDPSTPSGGNTYDRALCHGLAAAGWAVTEHPVAGGWPRPTATDRDALARVLAGLPDRAVVLLDGLVGCAAPEVVGAHRERLRLVMLVHLPLGDETGLTPSEAAELSARERASLRAASRVVATSGWAAQRLVALHDLPAEAVHVAAPGVTAAPPAPGTDGASHLLCVAALIPRKGQDLLVDALATMKERPWRCVCAGALDRAPAYVDRLRHTARAYRIADRVQLVGPRTGEELAATYAAADLLVLPSRAETYGMVVTEALARGIPVLTTSVGGLPEALGRAPDGSLPGMLIPPSDATALAGALRRWLGDPDLRRRLRAAARGRRAGLPDWDVTVRRMVAALRATTAGAAG